MTLQGLASVARTDTHIDASEPRAFPGMLHDRERRMSMKVSTSESDGNTEAMSGSMGGSVERLAGLRGSLAGLNMSEQQQEERYRVHDTDSD